MIKKLLIIFVTITVLTSCIDDDLLSNDYTFSNPTIYDVKVKPNLELSQPDAPDFELNVNAGETKTYKSDFIYGIFEITSNTTDRNFFYDFEGNSNVIYSFEHKVEYKIYGTANSADLTYSTPSGGTGQRTVSLPYSIEYDSFGDSFLYISAQKNDEFGTINVEIYYEDNLRSSDSCSGIFCIATADYSF
jgi:hypothetical protein